MYIVYEIHSKFEIMLMSACLKAFAAVFMKVSCRIDKVPEKRVFLSSPNPSRQDRGMAKDEEDEERRHKSTVVVALCVYFPLPFFYLANK